VDKAIEIILDIIVPGKGAGVSNWLQKGLRTIEHHADRAQREIEIRSTLRNWDQEYPWMHHELIIRYVASFAASSFALMLYRELRGFTTSRPATSSRRNRGW